MTAVLYAVLCMIFAACNDLLFKFFARKNGSRGILFAIIGVLWCIFTMFTLGPLPGKLMPTLIWGCISGAFSIGGNLLLIAAMSKLSAGLCSTIYRLNMVPAVLGAWLLLNESISFWQTAGIIAAIAAVLLFMPSGGDRSFSWQCFIMVLCGSFMRAGMGLSYRYGFNIAGADRDYVVMINALFWIIGGIIWYFTVERKQSHPDLRVLKYGLLSGTLVTLIIIFMALSLQYGRAAIVLPISNMSFLLTGAAGILFLKEKFTWKTASAFAGGVAAIILLSVFS